MPTRILLVDDEPAQRLLTSERLTAEGYVVVTAGTAREALACARSQRPDLIVSDVLMGEMDGFGLCRRLQDDTLLGLVPVILVSAHYTAADAGTASSVGASALVERTPGFEAELAAIRVCLGDRHRRPGGSTIASYEAHLRANATQLARLNEHAQRADRLFETLLDQAHDAVLILALDGTILHANRRWEELLGIPPAAIVGKHFRDFVAPAAVQDIELAFELDVVRGGSQSTIAPIRRADGAIVYLDFSSRRVELPDGSRMIAIGRDITEQLESNRRLAAAERDYRLLVDQLPDIVYRIDLRTGRAIFSPNVTAITGLAPDEAHDRWMEQVHRDDRERLATTVAAAVATSTTQEVEYRFATLAGVQLWLRSRVTASALPDGGAYLSGLTSDVTARRVLEASLAQAQKLEAVGRLSGGIAHDFNNILAATMMNVHMLIEELAPNDPRRETANEIKLATERGARLTRQLLAFSRKQVLDLVVIDLGEVVEGLQRMLWRLLGEDIAIEVHAAPGLGAISGDVGQFEQVLVNLAVNARDAMPNGGSLVLTLANAEVHAGDISSVPPGSYVEIVVRDTGCGMDEETKRQAFEPFFTTKPEGKGTGLGLSTSYGIVHQMGGCITVDSEPGVGTTFAIYIPRFAGHCETVTVEVITIPGARVQETVLLVEDDTAVQTAMARVLSEQGFAPIVASSVTQAIEIIRARRKKIDIVVSDVVMPGKTGVELVGALRELQPDTPVILMTGFTDHAALESYAAHPNNSIMQKPFEPAALVRRLRQVLDEPGAARRAALP